MTEPKKRNAATLEDKVEEPKGLKIVNYIQKDFL